MTIATRSLILALRVVVGLRERVQPAAPKGAGRRRDPERPHATKRPNDGPHDIREVEPARFACSCGASWTNLINSTGCTAGPARSSPCYVAHARHLSTRSLHRVQAQRCTAHAEGSGSTLVAGSNPAPATMSDEGLADADAAS